MTGPRSNTAALMGDPPPGRTPWSGEAAQESSAVTALRHRLAAETDPATKANKPSIPAAQARAVAMGAALAPKSAAPEPQRRPVPATTAPATGADQLSDGTGQLPTLRPVEPISLTGLEPTTPTTTGPIFEWVEPQSLLVNAAYQRDLSERSINLIRRIVQGWDWTRFKPPVCSLGDSGLEVIDGQHTAIAAATHPQIKTIPVMIVETETVKDRASAFIGQNKDRLGITPMQLHHAAVAAEDEAALTINQVCQRAGVTLMMSKPHRWKTGQSMAVFGIGALIDRRHAIGARRVLEVLVAASVVPITANAIKAVEMVLFDPEYTDADPDHLADAIQSLGATSEREATVFAQTHRVPTWKALGIVWFRKCRKKRKPV